MEMEYRLVNFYDEKGRLIKIYKPLSLTYMGTENGELSETME
jgi:hypothetical protein